MKKNRTPLTEANRDRVKMSLQKMSILAQFLLMENTTELGVDYRIPFMNNFAKRIINDSEAIMQHIKTSGRMIVKVKDTDFSEDYASQIWRVLSTLVGLDIEIIKEFADNLEREMAVIEGKYSEAV